MGYLTRQNVSAPFHSIMLQDLRIAACRRRMPELHRPRRAACDPSESRAWTAADMN